MERLSVNADLRVGVEPDQRVEAPAEGLMVLCDHASGKQLVMAVRCGGIWLVFDSGLNWTKASTRAEAIMRLTEHALGVLGGSGYSTLVPHGLAEMP